MNTVGLALGIAQAFADGHWPQWRGPNLDGTTDAKHLPTTWSETENIIWKIALPWWGGSTPVVWGERIFITSPSPGKAADTSVPRGQGDRDPGGDDLLLLCLNRADGKLLWQRELGRGNQAFGRQNMASPSPVTDGRHVWALTGKGDLAAFDFDGKEAWRRNLQKELGAFDLKWGYASSPLLLDDRLIIQLLHRGTTNVPSRLIAMDKATGKTLWQTPRPTDAVDESHDAYSTPMPFKHGGQTEIVVNGGDAVTGHDPATGRELWRVVGFNPEHADNHRTIGSPLCVGNVIIAPSNRNPTLAIKAGGRGDVSATHVLWKHLRGPDVPTPVSDGKLLWLVDDTGMTGCFELGTGKPLGQPQRVARGKFSASPVLADGKIYVLNEAGLTAVLAATPDVKVLATNKLDGIYGMATPAVAGDRLYIRTGSSLYCIGNKGGAAR